MTHSTCLNPSSVARLPPVLPARDSSEPKYDRAPDDWYAPMPALNATTGIPVAIAFFTTGSMAGGSGRVTAMPSTLLSIALWISVASLPESGSDEYLRVTLSFAAAAWAPLRMMSQNVSPGAAWVAIAMVICGGLALPPATPPLFCSDFLPPLLLQPAAATARPATSAMAASRLTCLDICIASGQCD